MRTHVKIMWQLNPPFFWDTGLNLKFLSLKSYEKNSENEEMIVAVNAIYAIAQKSCWRGFT